MDEGEPPSVVHTHIHTHPHQHPHTPIAQRPAARSSWGRDRNSKVQRSHAARRRSGPADPGSTRGEGQRHTDGIELADVSFVATQSLVFTSPKGIHFWCLGFLVITGHGGRGPTTSLQCTETSLQIQMQVSTENSDILDAASV